MFSLIPLSFPSSEVVISETVKRPVVELVITTRSGVLLVSSLIAVALEVACVFALYAKS
jgi:hypothetical protein